MSSFGEELRRERELRQITLREIAEATKISLRYLDALERNDFRNLPGGVFNKGFVRAYSQYIGVDPEAMVNAYLLEARGQLAVVPGDGPGAQVFRPHTGVPARSTVRTHEPNRRLRWPVVVAVALVVIAAGALAAWWWTTQRPGGPSGPLPNGRVSASPEVEPRAGDADPSGARGAETEIPAAGVLVPPHPPEILDQAPATEPGAEDSRIRIVLQRATAGRLNCDNRRVEVLDGMAVGTELVFTCRDFLRVDALDGGALLLQRGRAEAASLAPDGVPVVSRDLVPPRAVEEPL